MKWNEDNETCPYCRKRISKKSSRVEYIEIENDVEHEILVYPSLKDYYNYIFSSFLNGVKK